MLTIVTGPPCSGKSTYVQQHRHPGDVTIDFDKIAMTLGGETSHGHGEHIREITAAAWAAAIRRAVDLHQRHRIWIIDARPKADRRSQYDRAGARFVRLTAEAAELHKRATADGRPQSVHERIDEWFTVGSDPEPTSRLRW